MAVSGTNSENKDMRILAKEIVLNGSAVTGGVTQYTDAQAVAAMKAKTQIAALVSPTADYADLTAATAAIKTIIDALKA